MNDAVIVSTARTPIGKAYRGAFNNLESPTMGAHVLKHAIERAKVEPGEVDDVVMGAAMQEGTQGFNLARHRPGHDHRSPVLLEPDEHRHGLQGGHGR